MGIPSDLLLRRPDIRRSEEDLHAATAQIGTATAGLYPKISLSGSIGLKGSESGFLGSLARRYWSIGPTMQWPVFHSGALRANVEQQKALSEAAVANYKSAVLVALQEVESSMVGYQQEQLRTKALRQSLQSLEHAVRLSTELYQSGNKDFLNVITAQHSKLETADTLAESHRLALTSLISVYKALEGGWDSKSS